MSRETFDIEAALEKCHAGTAWQRDLIRAQLIAAQADAFERAERYRRALLKLACLGNGDCYGNSHGNVIAQEALAEGDGKS